MASITITIPDVNAVEVLNLFANRFNYTGTDPDGNAETKVQFAKRIVANWIKQQYQAQAADEAATAARATSFTTTGAVDIS